MEILDLNHLNIISPYALWKTGSNGNEYAFHTDYGVQYRICFDVNQSIWENGAYEFTEAFELLDGNFGDSCEVTLKAIGNNVVFTSGEQLDNSLFNKISLNGRDDVYEYDLSSIDIDFSYAHRNCPFPC